ncbi:hypothetical protein EDB85DRAFT_2137468 [Lactarius pseudohatsudake]|nr:hypothetical protein EDB85DRAFT_2137468 [Lactarius pseudohatsudake]
MRPQGASSDSESDPDPFDKEEDNMIYTAKHLGNGIAFRSRIFPRHSKDVAALETLSDPDRSTKPHDGDDLGVTTTVTRRWCDVDPRHDHWQHGANEAAAAGQHDNDNGSCADYTDDGNDCNVTTITTVMSMAAATMAAAITGSQ